MNTDNALDPFEFLYRYLDNFRRSLARERLLEAAAVLAISSLSLFAVAVAVVSLFPSLQAVSVVVLVCVGAIALVLAGHYHFVVRRRLADNVHLALVLRELVPELGTGLATVMSLRSDASCSAALLYAEAMRDAHVLAAHAPESLVRHRHVIRLVISLAFLVIALIVLSLAFPWSVSRGVRGLLGISVTGTPAWLMGPQLVVDNLAYDLKTAFLINRPDGTTERITGDETGEVFASEGSIVEVSGRLTVPATMGYLVVTYGKGELKIPLELPDEGVFKASFAVKDNGTWHLSLITKNGDRQTEATRRRISLVPAEPPRVWVKIPEKLGVKPGEDVSIMYSAESATGLVGIDAVQSFPMEPERPVVRIHVATNAPGTRFTRGEARFLLPEGVLEAGGYVLVVIEALGRTAKTGEATGRSEPVPLFVDVPKVRNAAIVTEADRLLSILVDRMAGDQVELKHVVEVARRLAAEARLDMTQLASALDSVADINVEGVDEQTLKKAILALDAALGPELVNQIATLISDMKRETSRLRSFSGTIPEADKTPDEVRRTVSRVKRQLVYAQAQRRRMAKRAWIQGTRARVLVARLSDAIARAADTVAGMEQAMSRDDGKTVSEGALRLAAAIEEIITGLSASLRLDEKTRVVTLPYEVVKTLHDAIERERELVDRTAQEAFELKRKEEILAASHKQEIERLVTQAEDAKATLGKVNTEGLTGYDAAELAAIRDDVAALIDILEGHDLEAAYKMAADVTGRANMLAYELREYAEWAEDTTKNTAAIRQIAARLSKAAGSIREIQRALGALRREREALIGQVERERLMELSKAQERVAVKITRLYEAIRTASGGTDEAASAAGAAKRGAEEATKRLRELKPGAAEAHERQVVQELLRLKRVLEHGSDEYVKSRNEPQEDMVIPVTTPPSDELRNEVQRYMKEPPLSKFADLVKAYYESILRP